MNRKKKRDPRRKAPIKSKHALRYVNARGALVYKTTTFVTPAMREALSVEPAVERW